MHLENNIAYYGLKTPAQLQIFHQFKVIFNFLYEYVRLAGKVYILFANRESKQISTNIIPNK